jgi:LysR family glycine cleavage system transcriptional activator
MGISPYVDDDLAAGRLVAPFGPRVPKGRRWYLVHRAARAEDPGFRIFRDWLVAQSRLPPAETSIPTQASGERRPVA